MGDRRAWVQIGELEQKLGKGVQDVASGHSHCHAALKGNFKASTRLHSPCLKDMPHGRDRHSIYANASKTCRVCSLPLFNASLHLCVLQR